MQIGHPMHLGKSWPCSTDWMSMWAGFRKPFTKVANLRKETKLGQTYGKPGGLVYFGRENYGAMILRI